MIIPFRYWYVIFLNINKRTRKLKTKLIKKKNLQYYANTKFAQLRANSLSDYLIFLGVVSKFLKIKKFPKQFFLIRPHFNLHVN